MKALRLSLCCLLLAAAALLAADPVQPPEANVVPPDVGAFVSVNVDEIWKSDAFKDVRAAIEKESPEFGQEIESLVGLRIDEIERVTLFLPTLPSVTARDPSFGVLVTAKKPYDPVKLLNALDAYGPELMEAQEAQRERERFDRERKMVPKLTPFPGNMKMKDKMDDSKAKVPGLPQLKIDGPKLEPIKEKLLLKEKQFSDLPNGGPEEIMGKMRLPDLNAPFYVSRKNRTLVYLVGDRSLAVFPQTGREQVGLYSYLGLLLKRSQTGPLAAALAVTAKNQVVAGIDLKQAARVYGKMVPDGFPGRDLLSTTSATLTANLGTEAKLELALDCADTDAAKSLEKTVNGLLTVLRDQVSAAKKGDDDAKTWAEVMLGGMEPLLRTAACKVDGKVIRLTASAPVEKTIRTALASVVAERRTTAERARFINNFKQIGLAAHAYHDAYGQLPFPGQVNLGQTAPNLSWRVALLPYFEEGPLFAQFKFDEPWDSEHNKKLIAKMPKIYAARPEAKLKEGETLVQCFSGPKAMRPRIRFADFTDGLSNTFMVAEAGEPVIWTKPDDMAFDPDKPLPKLGGNFGGDFVVAFCDGSVRFIPRKKYTDQVLKWLIMPADGNVIPYDR